MCADLLCHLSHVVLWRPVADRDVDRRLCESEVTDLVVVAAVRKSVLLQVILRHDVVDVTGVLLHVLDRDVPGEESSGFCLDLGREEGLEIGTDGARCLQRIGQRHVPEPIGQLSFFQLFEVTGRALLRNAPDVEVPYRLKASRAAPGEQGEDEPAPDDPLALTLGNALVRAEPEIQRVREVQRVLRADHLRRDETGGLDRHEEILEVELPDDLQNGPQACRKRQG